MSAISVDPASLPSVQAALNYVAPMTEKPFNYTYGPPPGMPRTNAVQDPRTVAIHSLRPVERELSLDGEGFAIAHHKSAVADFYDEDELTRVYYPEIEALVMSPDRRAAGQGVRPHGAAAGMGHAGPRSRRGARAGDARP